MIDVHDIQRERANLISAIRRRIRPKLRPSGLVERTTGRTLPVVMLPKDPVTSEYWNGDWGRVVDDDYYELDMIFGFTEEGVICDVHVAAAITPYDALPLEDLLQLREYVEEIYHLLE